MKLSVERLLDGVEALTHTISGPVPPGRHEQKLSIEFPLVGEFRARLLSADDEEIGVDDYMFVVHPVMDEDLQGILYSREGKVDELPAERVWLPWENEKTWYADPMQSLTVTRDDKIYVPLNDGKVARTPDGGRTWCILEPSKELNTVLRDGTFVAASYDKDSDVLTLDRSNDEGKSWGRAGEIPRAGNPLAGPITELADGCLIAAIGRLGEGVIGGAMYAHRSSDRGRSWSEGYPICPGGEPAIIELSSGRLLAVVRDNTPVPADDWQRCFKNEMAWRHFQRLSQQTRLTSYVKRLLLAESDDGGVTWTNVHPCTFLLNEMHGGMVELPDGRVVLLYTHRCPPLRGGERATISRDGGRTWDPELYHLNTTRAFPGYSAACVLPPHLADGKQGMILTLVGERSEGNWGDGVGPPTSEGIEFAPRMQAIRWRPLD
jgi:hypothetical protein